jgi:hypothetical protein
VGKRSKTDADYVERALKGIVAGNSFSLDPRNKERVKQVIAKYLRLDRVDKAEEDLSLGAQNAAVKTFCR